MTHLVEIEMLVSNDIFVKTGVSTRVEESSKDLKMYFNIIHKTIVLFF